MCHTDPAQGSLLERLEEQTKAGCVQGQSNSTHLIRGRPGFDPHHPILSPEPNTSNPWEESGIKPEQCRVWPPNKSKLAVCKGNAGTSELSISLDPGFRDFNSYMSDKYTIQKGTTKQRGLVLGQN